MRVLILPPQGKSSSQLLHGVFGGTEDDNVLVWDELTVGMMGFVPSWVAKEDWEQVAVGKVSTNGFMSEDKQVEEVKDAFVLLWLGKIVVLRDLEELELQFLSIKFLDCFSFDLSSFSSVDFSFFILLNSLL